ncbi:unnamed protein product [Rhizophagus irregularis]|nr:unnamed protein product [Rhizophagus irregularis]
MSGSPIRQAKDAILQIMGGLIERKVLAEKDITCFFFQSFCQEIRFRDHPGMLWANGGIKRYFEDVRSGGGTSFSAAFSSIIENLDRINTDLAIIFFTDGQDTDTRNNLEYAKTGLKTALKEASYSTEVHSIGFTNEHDAKLLSWLTKCGRKEGNFLYIRSSDEIVGKMKTTLQLLESSYKTLYVKIGDENPQPANFDDEGVAVLILNDDASSVEEDDGSKSERFNQILAEINAYEEQLNTITSKKSSISSVIIQQCLDIKSTVLKFKDVLSEGLLGTLTNEKIAIINDLAYRNIVRQKITKRKLISHRFCDKLCQDFATFYEQKKFCDVTIEVGLYPNNQKFEAHASILYARSTFFRKILDKGILHVIEVSGISSKTFEVLLKYIYSGYISLDNEPSEIFDLLLAAIKLDFEEVISYLESQLIKQHHKWLHENFELVHRTSQQHGILVDFCTDVIMNMLEKFLSDDFCEIKEAVLIELLKSHKLKLDEIEIWNRILKWGLAKHPSLNPDPKVWSPKEVEAFSMTLKDILPLIRFFQFSSDQFTNSVRPYRKILSEDLYEELISYYMIPGNENMKF